VHEHSLKGRKVGVYVRKNDHAHVTSIGIRLPHRHLPVMQAGDSIMAM
jgi:lipoate-protein ligase B